MNYRITITKTGHNPHYQEELERYEKDRRWENTIEPQLEIVDNVLPVKLTDEQFIKAKAEVLKSSTETSRALRIRNHPRKRNH